MNNLTIIAVAILFWFIFWGPHAKPKEKKDDKKGGGKK
jgi:hypothetical protein